MNKLHRAVIVLVVLGLITVAVVMGVRRGGDVVQRGLQMSTAAAKPAGPFEFSILEYNVQARPWLDDAQEKLPKISPLLNGYDVVGIEECFQKHHLLWGQAQYPNKVYFGSLYRPWKLANSGLSLMTKLPLGEVEMEHYRDNGEFQNRVASKGILLARVDAGGWPIDLYLTHMEAGDRPEAQVARMGQAKQVVEFVTRHSPPEHGVVLFGDFNMMPLRAEKKPEEYSPHHFSDEADLLGRTAAFGVMRDELKLRDASDELFGPVKDDIERYLFRAPAGARMEAVSLENSGEFHRADGTQLSDGSPFIARFRLNSAGAS